MIFTEEINRKTPKAFGYFMDFYENEYEGKLENIKFEELAFELQLGVYIRFFDQINSDIQVYSTNMDVLRESVIEAFETYEEYLFLDS